MRRIAPLAFALVLASALALSGCASDSERSAPSQQQGVSDVIQSQTQQEEGDETNSGNAFVGDDGSIYDRVDFDLTEMSADMVYATVYDMMANPDAYEGKTVRVAGPYYHTFYEQTGQDYFYVVIQDATACCAQGLGFVWGDGSHVFPRDYPEDGTEVVVAGVFETYTEGTSRYVHLVNASLQVG